MWQPEIEWTVIDGVLSIHYIEDVKKLSQTH